MPKRLDDAFQVTIDRISSQSLTKANQGMEILKWTFLTKKKKRLNVTELRNALAASASSSDSLDILKDLPYEKSLIDCCCGLVVIDNETSSIRLVHKSLQDFLKKKYDKNKLFSTGHLDIARSCLTYMNSKDTTKTAHGPAIDREIIRDVSIYNHRRSDSSILQSTHVKQYPFLRYAIHFWGQHAAEQIDGGVTELAVQLFLVNGQSGIISQGLLPLVLPDFGYNSTQGPREAEYDEYIFKKMISSLHKVSGLHLAAHFSLSGVCKSLLSRRRHININSILYLKIPLLIACEKGYEKVVPLILQKIPAAIEWKDDQGQTPLSLAAANGNESIVRLLLEFHDVNVNLNDFDGGTPILWAALRSRRDSPRALRLHPFFFQFTCMTCISSSNVSSPPWSASLLWMTLPGSQRVG
jgi:hypothetical protein